MQLKGRGVTALATNYQQPNFLFGVEDAGVEGVFDGLGHGVRVVVGHGSNAEATVTASVGDAVNGVRHGERRRMSLIWGDFCL